MTHGEQRVIHARIPDIEQTKQVLSIQLTVKVHPQPVRTMEKNENQTQRNQAERQIPHGASLPPGDHP